ncbi:MAG TPA: glycosyltransferase family 4 protein [Anaerolineae bacterium]|nr:glycosyltransferase family 4 protein [Anaerolineae bacterium]HQJ50837.1 glycosyltransferase family 4 protein [Anaerolineae bacterium]
MKILVVLTYYYPHWTGLTAYARRLSEGLARRGHQVTVLTAQYWKTLPAEEVHNGVRIVRLPTIMRLSRGVIMPGFPAAANRLIREHDVVQVHVPIFESPLVTALAKRYGKKVVITHHGDLVMPSRPFDQFVQFFVTGLMRRALSQSARITIHTRDYAECSPFLSQFSDKLVQILPPVEIPLPQPERVKAWRQELGLDGVNVVGFAGRFVEEKGFDYLLKAVPLVLEQLPNTRFVYAGEVNVVYEPFFERWRHLQERWKEQVLMLGLLDEQQQVANFYALCDVLALPSRTDCFPMVQVESMLCGTPTVATDIPGLRVPVKLTGMGRLVKPMDEQALAEGLVDVLRNRSQYLRPREDIARLFDLETTIDGYERLFQSLV